MVSRIFYKCILLSILFFLQSCPGHEDAPPTRPSIHITYAGPELKSLPFDASTGTLKTGLKLKNLSQDDLRLKFRSSDWEEPQIIISSLPDGFKTFNIKGYHALLLDQDRKIGALLVYDSYLRIASTLKTGSVHIGGSSRDSGASVFVAKALITEKLSIERSSFLEVEPDSGMVLIYGYSSKKNFNGRGIIIDAPPYKRSELLNILYSSVEISDSRVKASAIHIHKDNKIRLDNATLIAEEFVSNGAVVHVARSPKFIGKVMLSSDSNLFLETNFDTEKWEIEIGSLNIEGPVHVDANISLHSFLFIESHPNAVQYFKALFNRQAEFVLIKAQELSGRARLVSRNILNRDFGKEGDLSKNFIEKFADMNDMKLALQHDYLKKEIRLKFVNKNEKTDEYNCLPDIGRP